MKCPTCYGTGRDITSGIVYEVELNDRCPKCRGLGEASPRQRDRIEHARAMRKLQRRLNKAKGREKALKRVLDFERQRGAAWHKRADLNRGRTWQEMVANEHMRAELENRREWDKARSTGTIIAAAIAFAWLALWPACEVLS